MTQPNRSAAYGVIALCVILALAMLWPSGTPTPPQALAQQPVIATRPAWTPRPAMPRDVPPVVPTEVVVVAAVDSVAATVAEPQQPQIVYESDGSATLAGVDGPAVDRSAPADAPVESPDVALYKSLPVAGEPPAGGGRPLMVRSHGGR